MTTPGFPPGVPGEDGEDGVDCATSRVAQKLTQNAVIKFKSIFFMLLVFRFDRSKNIPCRKQANMKVLNTQNVENSGICRER